MDGRNPFDSGMPSATISEPMPCESAVVFGLLHDYPRRLEWDTLLREARLTRGHATAAVGATSLCVGKAFFGRIGIETRYVTFTPGVVAAVVMINRAPFFGSFAASIRHEDKAGGSVAIYKFRFKARPWVLRWLLEPVMLAYLRRETRRRLRALARHLAKGG
jgi:Polyketide cyclase / dehydrase and lipid transport